jgi:hypothetical protein
MTNLWTFVTLTVFAAEHKTLLAQEIGALEDIIAAAQKKVTVLKELQSKVGRGLQEFHPVAHSLLNTPLPSLSELPKSVTSSADDVSYKMSKITAPFPVLEVKFVPLRASSVSPTGSTLQALVACLTETGVLLYTPSGALVAEWLIEEPTFISAGPTSYSQDEVFFVVFAKGKLTRINVKTRQWRLSGAEKEDRRNIEPRNSTTFVPEVNVTLSKAWSYTIKGEITSLQAMSSRGQKYIVLGGKEGGLYLHSLNGTYLGYTQAADDGDDVLELAYTASLVYRSSTSFGMFSPDEQVVHRPCGSVTKLTSAVQLVGAQKLLVHVDGELQSIGTKDKTTCEREWKLPFEPVRLHPLKGMVLGLTSGDEKRLIALDTTRGAPEEIMWERKLGNVIAFDVFRRFGGGGMFATLSGSKTTIEVWDLLNEPPRAPGSFGGFGGGGDGGDSLSNMKMPIFMVAILLVVGYQYMKISNKKTPGKSSKGGGLADLKRLAELKKRN